MDDVATCNKCGKPFEERTNGYPTTVETSGGYNSIELFDGNRYTFSVCEPCLVEYMSAFAVPPTVYDSSEGGFVSWNQDREQIQARKVRERKAQESRAEAIRTNTCTSREFSDTACCSVVSAAYVNDEPTCERHLADKFARSCTQHTVIRFGDGSSLNRLDMCRIGLAFIETFRRSDSFSTLVGPEYEHERHIWISTLFSLIFESPKKANLWLLWLTHTTPPRASSWVHPYVSGAFPPGTLSEITTVVNDWLTWGEAAGYANAVAFARPNRPAEDMWA